MNDTKQETKAEIEDALMRMGIWFCAAIGSPRLVDEFEDFTTEIREHLDRSVPTQKG